MINNKIPDGSLREFRNGFHISILFSSSSSPFLDTINAQTENRTLEPQGAGIFDYSKTFLVFFLPKFFLFLKERSYFFDFLTHLSLQGLFSKESLFLKKVSH
ncbi:hypothetical protein COU57_00085 [Candidatus Pacearchaeota archaeon CG10_big_fil_rev_8_21_14_0_10_32_14]|nr:MAG: hypothetical protein COU57_00085 [Candidatus Pacearchaeota archaeon CG10_big_fil_rev_8_21_14_0_10_32_14]